MAKALYDVPAYTNDWLITVRVPNPKRPLNARGEPSDCWVRFEAFFKSTTVADFAKLCGKGYRAEIAWCAARGYITLLDPSTVDEADEAEVEAVDAE